MPKCLRFVASIGILFALSTAAHATVGCDVVSPIHGAKSVNLYTEPSDTSEVIREVPLGDIVLYPAQELAPHKSDTWVWVRHDASQENIWNSGAYGWMKPDNMGEYCG